MNFIKKTPLYIQIIIGVVLGAAGGLLFPQWAGPISIIGKVFLKLLKMLIIPLIFSSIIMGVVSTSSAKSFGRMGVKTFIWYISTSLLAILTGQFLVNLLKPGHFTENITLGTDSTALNLSESLSVSDLILNLFPDNVVGAMANGQVLPIIFFALLTGFFIIKLKESEKKTLSEFFNAVYELMMKMTGFVILLAPIGIFALLYDTVAASGIEVFKSLFFYFMTVTAALMIHFFITLPLLMFVFTRRNPYSFMKKMLTPLLTAFSTSSSSATLPLTISTIENKVGVSNRVAGFVLPLGATINMDGTALYECVAVIFIAQVTGIDLTFSQQVLIVATSLMVSIGAAGIPMAGLVMMTIILKAVNLPLEGVGLILAVDRFLDMFRTCTNVLSDSTGTYIIAHSENEITETNALS